MAVVCAAITSSRVIARSGPRIPATGRRVVGTYVDGWN
jgi:hypothetical protein